MIELFNIDLLSYTVQTAETAPTHSYTIYWLILLGSMLLSWLVSARMKSRFSEYSQIPIPVTGREVAEQMLNMKQPLQSSLTGPMMQIIQDR